MTEQELKALALLTGGKVFKGQLLLPQQAQPASPGMSICPQCHLEKEPYEVCEKFTDRSNAPACDVTNIVWQPIKINFKHSPS